MYESGETHREPLERLEILRDGQVEASGPWFPHVYGPLPVAAVVGVHPFPPEPDGTFRLPASLAER